MSAFTTANSRLSILLVWVEVCMCTRWFVLTSSVKQYLKCDQIHKPNMNQIIKTSIASILFWFYTVHRNMKSSPEWSQKKFLVLGVRGNTIRWYQKYQHKWQGSIHHKVAQLMHAEYKVGACVWPCYPIKSIRFSPHWYMVFQVYKFTNYSNLYQQWHQWHNMNDKRSITHYPVLEASHGSPKLHNMINFFLFF
jgi:hypothetical protein